MPASLNAWTIIVNASFPVQLVMLILLIMSIMSWMLIFKRARDLKFATAAMLQFEERFWSGIDLSRLFVQIKTEPDIESGQENIFRAGFKEFARLRQMKGAEGESVMEGSQRAMRVALSREQEKLDLHLPFLATVGSISPYIGLFGTVWGIMSSFLALAQKSQVTLQVVAPDIAEALLATAMGLFAAIPAVIAYNRFTANSDALYARYLTFADEFSSILHRKAHETEITQSSN